ncbi:hypothetical protein FRC08_005098 [Ceratobasidium sp. 394]|nr:hypothetical protein FRC08_005098 [Ceratobasidium sp. 394]
MPDSEKTPEPSSPGLEQPLLGESAKNQETRDSNKSEPATKLRYHERSLGVWTLYYPITASWTDSIPTLGSFKRAFRFVASIPTVWRFLLESVSLAPLLFAIYFIVSVVSGIVPSIQLQNNSKILNLAERVLTDHGDHAIFLKEFTRVFTVYLVAVVIGWGARRLDTQIQPIIEQRVSLHFKRRLLEVRSRLDLTVAENPEIKSQMDKATSYHSRAWSILEALAELMSISIELAGQVSVLAQMLGTREDAKLFGLVCFARPLITQMVYSGVEAPYYAMVTNHHWLRMKALYKLGTSSKYKKEVLSGGLDSFINSQYSKDMEELGDVSGDDPSTQLYRQKPFAYDDIRAVFDSIPLLLFAWGNIHNGRSDGLSLTSLVMIQQAANAFQNIIWRITYSGRRMWGLFDNAVALYEVLDLKPAMKDGDINYPDEEHAENKGAAIEFRGVNFTYPMTEKPVLKDLSFTIKSGQLCVIVGENGCGKSTTINLLTRLYDSTSGTVFIDGRAIGEYKISSLRAATNVMYQDYRHLPLTVQENILLGCPDSKNPEQGVEEASKLGGSYDFVQKLPLKFSTNIEPEQTGFSSRHSGENTAEKYKKFVDAQKPTKLSGGEWQRLALSRTFMKNSDQIRLLCYDEPSASLDPKAEYEIFERLRNLRGERTMIFVTHRFGHLTKHADLILYVKDGSIIEKGTHKQLLAQDGEYAKMYAIQSQAFSD